MPTDALYNALPADAELQPPNWDLQGRQTDTWKTLGYIPQDVFERSGTNSKQVSRSVEVLVAYNFLHSSADLTFDLI